MIPTAGTTSPTSEQTHAARELGKLSDPALRYVVDVGFLDTPSSESCEQCDEGPGICFLADGEVDLSTVPDRAHPGRTLGVIRVCSPLCVRCCVDVAKASVDTDRVFSVDVTTWAQ